MDEILDRILEEARSAWRFRWIGLGAAAVLAAVGWIVVFALPDRYEATASVFVDTRTALRSGTQGLTMEQDVNVPLNYARQSLLAGDRAEKIARASGVLPRTEQDPRKVEGILDEFVKGVEVDVRSVSGREGEREAGSIYTFRFQDSTRERSLKVTETLLTSFVEESLGVKRASAQDARVFLEESVKSKEDEIRTIEAQISDFKRKHLGLMPTDQGGVVPQLEAELDTIKRLENDLSVKQQSLDELDKLLKGDSAIGAAGPGAAPGSAAAGGDTLSMINASKARLNDLLRRFTDKHPDVVAERRILEQLEAQWKEEQERLRSGDPGAIASSGAGANPVYQSNLMQFNQLKVEIRSLTSQLKQHRDKAVQLRSRLDTAPQVEAEWSELTRGLALKKQQLEDVQKNLDKFRMGASADDAGSVRFEVMQPPTAPFGPVFPKRSLFIAAALVLALAAGAGLTYLLHLIRPVVGSLRGLSDLTGLPVLGVVSSAFPQQLTAQARRSLLGFLGAGAILVAACAVVLVLNHAGLRISGGFGS